MPEAHLLDGGRFIQFMSDLLPDAQLRLVLSLTAPLRRILMVQLYNAYQGQNNVLVEQLQRVREHRFGDAMHEDLAGDTA
jgi:hypothetical protein